MLFSADGRIRRRDWWLYSVFLFFIYWIVVFTTNFTIAVFGGFKHGDNGLTALTVLLISPIYIWPQACVTSKRWHDRNRSGYWSILTLIPFIGLVPFIGSVWTLVECGIFDGTHGPNKYGPSPKGLNHEENLF